MQVRSQLGIQLHSFTEVRNSLKPIFQGLLLDPMCPSVYVILSRVELCLFGLSGTASHPDM